MQVEQRVWGDGPGWSEPKGGPLRGLASLVLVFGARGALGRS
jgi:hypothetical protein